VPKPVKRRPSYKSDAGFLIRLAASVELDDDMPEAWRRETSVKLSGLAEILLAAEKVRVEKAA